MKEAWSLLAMEKEDFEKQKEEFLEEVERLKKATGEKDSITGSELEDLTRQLEQAWADLEEERNFINTEKERLEGFRSGPFLCRRLFGA